MRHRIAAVIGASALLSWSSASSAPRLPTLMPTLATEAVSVDADDPSIWIDAAAPERSLIIGTNKVAAPRGALVVFGLDGRTRQVVDGLDRPNNVDVEYGLRMPGGRTIDIAVTTERRQHRLRVYAIARATDAGAPLTDVLTDVSGPGGIPVLDGEKDAAQEPMGIALYKRPSDGAIFAIVAPKTGGATDYLWQYRLDVDAAGRVTGTMVRRFGSFSGVNPGPDGDNEIEAVAVDDALGYVYYADENFGIRKWHADPNHADASRELSVFGRAGFTGNREGIGIYARPDGRGFIVCSDQRPNGTVFRVFAREGAPGAPHTHREIAAIPSTADSTDGLDVTATPLGPRFPNGLLVAMNSKGHNFFIYRWEHVTPFLSR